MWKAKPSAHPSLKVPLDILWPLPFATQITQKRNFWKNSSIFIGGAAFTLERPNGSTLGSKGIETRAKTKDTHRDVRLHRDKVTETKHTQRDTLACK